MRDEDLIKLSIIIPHYNDSKRLQRLLNSIPTEKEIEILVIDDNSDIAEQNKAEDIAVKYSETSYFFVNPNKESHSAGACRNIGLEHATGEWVLFADADDYFTDSFFDSVSKYFDSEYDVVFFETTSLDEETGEITDRHVSFSRLAENFLKTPCEKTELNLRYHHYVPWGKLIRKSLITDNDIRFEEIRYSNDLMFSTKVGAYAKKICADENIIYCVTSSGGSLTKIKNRESFDTRKRAMIRRYAFLYHHLTKNEMRSIDMKYTGIRYVMSPVRNGYGIGLAMEYLRLLKSSNAPLIV